MTRQERDSKILMMLLSLSAMLQKPRKLAKLTKNEKRFLFKISNRRYTSISPTEFTKLTELQEKYLCQ